MKLVGLPAQPETTLKELKAALKGAHWPGVAITLVGDWQGNRARLAYAVYVEGLKEPLFSYPALGGAFGERGLKALTAFVAWAQEKGARRFFEAMLEPGRLAGLAEAGEELAAEVHAAKNPAGPWLWPEG
jgi:nucleotide-binding universal stress UspA family protein